MLKKAMFSLTILLAAGGLSVFAAVENGFEKIEIVDDLNLAWQQYVSDETVVGRTPKTPKDYGDACKILLDSKRIESVPGQESVPGYVLGIIPVNPKTPAEIEFVAMPKNSQSAKLQENICKMETANLNAAWQMYGATKLAADEKIKIPDDYKSAVTCLINSGFVKPEDISHSHPDWEITWQKSQKPIECRFEAVCRKKTKSLPSDQKDACYKDVSCLNSLWQQYCAAQMAMGRSVKVPSDMNAAISVLEKEKYLDVKTQIHSKAYPDWKIVFRKNQTPQGCKFEVVCKNKALLADKHVVASELAILNSAWQQFVASTMANGDTPKIPADAKTAYETLVQAKFIEIKLECIDKIKFEKGKLAMECKFVTAE